MRDKNITGRVGRTRRAPIRRWYSIRPSGKIQPMQHDIVKIALTLILGLGIATGVIGPASAAVFGKDTRGPVPKAYAGAKGAVGVLTAPGRVSGNSCNAVCVAPQIIATSAHCLYFPLRDGSRPSLPRVSFTNANGQSAIAGVGRGNADWNVIAGATFVSRQHPWVAAHDWALVRLASPVCAGISLGLAVKNKWGDLFDDVFGDKVFVISHNRYGRAVRLQYSGSCDAPQNALQQAMQWIMIEMGSRDPKHLIPHRCDFKPGASGSPLLIEQAGQVAVLGINAAQSDIGFLERRLGETIASQVSANFAVSAAAFAAQIELLRKPERPLERTDVRSLQTNLRELGYYGGAIDGAYGRTTRQAILEFERHFDLLITGRPSQKLLTIIAGAAASPKAAREAVVRFFADPDRGDRDALAIDPESGASGRGKPDGNSAHDAAEKALAACGGTCRLYAIGREITFGLTQKEIDALIAERDARPDNSLHRP